MSFINFIKHVQRLPDRRADCVTPVDKLPIIAYMRIEIIKQFLRDFNADFWHTAIFSCEYYQRVATSVHTPPDHTIT